MASSGTVPSGGATATSVQQLMEEYQSLATAALPALDVALETQYPSTTTDPCLAGPGGAALYPTDPYFVRYLDTTDADAAAVLRAQTLRDTLGVYATDVGGSTVLGNHLTAVSSNPVLDTTSVLSTGFGRKRRREPDVVFHDAIAFPHPVALDGMGRTTDVLAETMDTEASVVLTGRASDLYYPDGMFGLDTNNNLVVRQTRSDGTVRSTVAGNLTPQLPPVLTGVTSWVNGSVSLSLSPSEGITCSGGPLNVAGVITGVTSLENGQMTLTLTPTSVSFKGNLNVDGVVRPTGGVASLDFTDSQGGVQFNGSDGSIEFSGGDAASTWSVIAQNGAAAFSVSNSGSTAAGPGGGMVVKTANNTLDDGTGNATFSGVVHHTGGLASANYLNSTGGTLVGGTWGDVHFGGGSATDAWKVMDQSGTPQFTVNNCDLGITGTGTAVKTYHNTLDDGNGNVLTSGWINAAEGLMSEGASVGNPGAVITNAYNNIHLLHGNASNDLWMIYNSGGLPCLSVTYLPPTGATSSLVKTYNNTLDDGNGNLVAGGYLHATNGVCSSFALMESGGAKFGGSTGNIEIVGGSSSSSWSVMDQNSNAQLTVSNTASGQTGVGAAVKTYHNTLDDGEGDMTVAGDLTLSTGSISVPYSNTSNYQIAIGGMSTSATPAQADFLITMGETLNRWPMIIQYNNGDPMFSILPNCTVNLYSEFSSGTGNNGPFFTFNQNGSLYWQFYSYVSGEPGVLTPDQDQLCFHYQNAYIDFLGNGGGIFSGSVEAQGTTLTSDARLKTDIVPECDGKSCLTLLASLCPVTFVYKTDKKKRKHHGFIAQDVEKVMPEIVHSRTDKEGQVTLSLSYNDLISMLCLAVTTLSSDIVSLTSKQSATAVALAALTTTVQGLLPKTSTTTTTST